MKEKLNITNKKIRNIADFLFYWWILIYIIPGIPPPPIGGAAGGVSSLISTKAHSVVRIIPATEAAFSRATLATFFGSIIPYFNISTYEPSLAS